MNTRFRYLYRDAANYKSWGEIIFGGSINDAMAERLMTAFEAGQFFIADQIRVPELFFDTWPDRDDHCFHEFDSLEVTVAASDDPHGRTIGDFVEETDKAAGAGWRVFNPSQRSIGAARQNHEM